MRRRPFNVVLLLVALLLMTGGWAVSICLGPATAMEHPAPAVASDSDWSGTGPDLPALALLAMGTVGLWLQWRARRRNRHKV